MSVMQGTIASLPDELLLAVFSYLQENQLCMAAMVCNHWNKVISDEKLWLRCLQRQRCIWVMHDNQTTSPYQNKAKSRSRQIIYDPDTSCKILCRLYAPNTMKLMRHKFEDNASEGWLRRFWHWSLSSKTEAAESQPSCLVLIGPGLESVRTSQIARKILDSRTSTFNTVGMVPSKLPAIGGIQVKFNSAIPMNIITLYSNVKKMREGMEDDDWLRLNRLITVNDASEANYQPKLVSSVKDVCTQSDGIVYVIDATSHGTLSANIERLLLHAIIEACEEEKIAIPILVLACVATDSTNKRSCLQVADHLQLGQFPNTPWHVIDVAVDTMKDADAGFQWLLFRTTINNIIKNDSQIQDESRCSES